MLNNICRYQEGSLDNRTVKNIAPITPHLT